MKKIQLISITVALLLAAVLSTSVSAQHSHNHNGDTSWKTGMLRISDPVWAGDVRLRSGMYHVKHVVVGEKHWLIFKSVTLGAGYREGSMFQGKEIARLECRVEPAEKSVRNTNAILGRNSAGQKSLQEIQLAGETVRHVVLSKPSS